jgi:hypothetical protein
MKLIATCALLFLFIFQDDARLPWVGECTIGVFSGRVTTDGRPILWKNRDITEPVQKFCYFAPIISLEDTTLEFIGDVNSVDTSRVYMGLNSSGFAIINGNSYNLGDQNPDGIDDGTLIRRALQRSRTLADFEELLNITNIAGRRDCWNFGCLDSTGACAIYECDNFTYVKYDARDSIGDGSGLILRATFSFSGDNNHDGLPRFKRASDLVRLRLRTAGIDPQFILQTLSRDLANNIANPYPLPYDGSQNGRPAGFILAHDITINRDISRSVAVIRGVAPGEDPRLATLYGTIGQPVVSVAYPLWVESHSVPAALNLGAEVPMYTHVVQRISRLYPIPNDRQYLDSRYLINKDSIGMFTYILPLESEMLAAVDSIMVGWRQNIPSSGDFAQVQNMLAESLYNAYTRIPMDFSPRFAQGDNDEPRLSNYPNPFNANTIISLSGFPFDKPVMLRIFDITGRQVREFQALPGQGGVVWDGKDGNANQLSSGVYLIKAVAPGRSTTTKALLIK